MGKFEEQLRMRVTAKYVKDWPHETYEQVEAGVDDQMEMLADRLFELLDGKTEW